MATEAAGGRPPEERLAKRYRISGCSGWSRCAERDALRRCRAHKNGPRWPVVVVDVRDPCEKGDDVANLLIRQVRVRHQPAVLFFGIKARRVLQELSEIGFSTELGDLRQVGCVVRTLAKQRVAVDAVLAVPHVLAGHHLRVSASSCVNRPNCLWLSMVRAMKTRANSVVPPTKNIRVCRLVISPRRDG